MTVRRRIAATATALLASGALLVGLAPPASAAEHDGSCDTLELCLFYNSNLLGAKHDFRYRVSNFAGYTFIGPGNGAGTPVKNNAASARNRDGFFTARVYFNSGFAGPFDNVSPLSWRNLGNTYNDNASYTWCYGSPLQCDD